MSRSYLLRHRLLAAALALSACDDGATITRVDRLVGDVRSYVTTMALGGMAVESHGAPFDGVTPQEVAARLRLPPAYPTGAGFRAAAPGDAERLVLDFNPGVPGRAAAACRGALGAAQRNRGEVGFSVSATLCSGERVLVSGHLDARRVRADDAEGFRRAMTALLQQMF